MQRYDFGIKPIRFQNPMLNQQSKPRKKRKLISKPLKRKVSAADFNYLMDKQKGFCANKKCRSLHGKRQRVTTTKDIDHKYPVKLWELKSKEGNVNTRSNLQLLCPDCHRRKTAEDRKKISRFKAELKEKRKKTTGRRRKRAKNRKSVYDFSPPFKIKI
jgi:5-methylcytosine-specific restriction endonuclease McrA